MRLTPRNGFRLAMIVTLVARLIAAFLIPMTGDEAYYVFWAKHLSYGYYDQPPMVGWLLAGLIWISDAKVWVRLPAIALPAIVAWVLLRLSLPRQGSRTPDARAYQTATLFVLAPIVNLLPAITTDIPLVFWVALVLACWDRAERDRTGWKFYGAAGAALGAAFLSKYFAVLLLPAAFVYWLLSGRKSRTLRGALIAGAISTWGPFLHLLWNWNHCWANIVFNLFVRNDQEHFMWWHIETYVYQQLYLLTPVLLFFLLRSFWDQRKKGRTSDPALWLALSTWLLPTLVFFALAFRFGIGMHFVIAFYPYYFLTLGRVLTPSRLQNGVRFAALWLALHVPLVIGVAALPLETYAHKGFYRGLIQTLEFERIAQTVLEHERAMKLQKPERSVQWLADAYSQAALLGFHAQRDVWVVGAGSDFGRATDFIADWRSLDGKDAVVLWQYETDPQWLSQYFEQVQTRRYQWGKLIFWVAEARGFKYAPYATKVLGPSYRHYYRPVGAEKLPGRCPLWSTAGGEL